MCRGTSNQSDRSDGAPRKEPQEDYLEYDQWRTYGESKDRFRHWRPLSHGTVGQFAEDTVRPLFI